MIDLNRLATLIAVALFPAMVASAFDVQSTRT